MDIDVNKTISDLINRLCNCMDFRSLYTYGNDFHIDVYPVIDVKRNDFSIINKKVDIVFVAGEETISTGDRGSCVQQIASDATICIYLCNSIPSGLKNGQYRVLKMPCEEYKYLYLRGDIFAPQKTNIPSSFKVLAIMHVYNEADIIERTIEYLLNQEIDIYVIDNWSDDGTYEIAEHKHKQNPDRVHLERFPATGSTGQFNLYSQMRRTEEISRKCEYEWYIHYDADEMRIAPWKRFNLREMLFIVDKMGYNLIENTVVDFKITDSGQSNIFMQNTWFDFGRKATHFEQRKTWKKSKTVELANNGGHIAIIENPMIFPLKILNRHYPLRSLRQAKKKVFRDRLPRFESEKKTRGWHGHYDTFINSGEFVFNEDNLLKWNETTSDDLWVPLFTGVGIKREDDTRISGDTSGFDNIISFDESYVIYGAGRYGRYIYELLAPKYSITAWVDKKFNILPHIYAVKIKPPYVLDAIEFDKVIIAVDSRLIAEDISKELVGLGIASSKLIWKEWSKLINTESEK